MQSPLVHVCCITTVCIFCRIFITENGTREANEIYSETSGERLVKIKEHVNKSDDQSTLLVHTKNTM